MSYTHQKVSWKACSEIRGGICNLYGDTENIEEVQITARKQPHEEVLTLEDGKTVLTRNIYYVEPSREPNAFSILKYDLLDGEKIINIYKMMDLMGNCKLIRFITI